MKSLRSFETKTVNIDRIKPYWRNPRIIPEEAVEAVQRSIETFGYMQPIVVDEAGVIIAGHTRYVAMRRMGVKEVEVIEAELSAREAKELRIIDNRSAEFSSWDYVKLLTEMKETGSDYLKNLFPEYSAETILEQNEGTEVVVDATTTTDKVLEFVCPHCFHDWEQMVTRDEIFNGKVGGSDE